MSEHVRMYLIHGKEAAKAGQVGEARSYLQRVLWADPTQEQKIEAYLWLAEVADTEAQRRDYLEEVLARNPTHAIARRRLAILEGRLDPANIIDPDALSRSAGTDGPAGTDVRHFDCPRCSARMVYTPDGTRLHCEHCGHDEGLAQSDSSDVVQGSAEQDFFVAMATTQGHMGPQLAQAFDCTSCAHAFLVGPEALSVICPYCDSVYVVDTLQLTSRQLIPPQALIPFSITVEQATARLRHWFQKKRVTASAVPHGMYVPAFTFDLGGMLSWKGYSGEGNQRQAVSGEFPLDVDDMVVPAYQPSPAFAAELQGYNLNALVPYDARYLANWPAEVYETTVADASLMARRQALKLKRSDIETRANARTPPVTITTVSSSAMMVTSYKLILLPLWLAHYQLQGRHFQVLINGQTGQVKGQYPRRGARGLLATLLTWLSR